MEFLNLLVLLDFLQVLVLNNVECIASNYDVHRKGKLIRINLCCGNKIHISCFPNTKITSKVPTELPTSSIGVNRNTSLVLNNDITSTVTYLKQEQSTVSKYETITTSIEVPNTTSATTLKVTTNNIELTSTNLATSISSQSFTPSTKILSTTDGSSTKHLTTNGLGTNGSTTYGPTTKEITTNGPDTTTYGPTTKEITTNGPDTTTYGPTTKNIIPSDPTTDSSSTSSTYISSSSTTSLSTTTNKPTTSTSSKTTTIPYICDSCSENCDCSVNLLQFAGNVNNISTVGLGGIFSTVCGLLKNRTVLFNSKPNIDTVNLSAMKDFLCCTTCTKVVNTRKKRQVQTTISSGGNYVECLYDITNIFLEKSDSQFQFDFAMDNTRGNCDMFKGANVTFDITNILNCNPNLTLFENGLKVPACSQLQSFADCTNVQEIINTVPSNARPNCEYNKMSICDPYNLQCLTNNTLSEVETFQQTVQGLEFTRIGNSVYHISSSKVTQSTAFNACISFGMYILYFETLTERSDFFNWMTATGNFQGVPNSGWYGVDDIATEGNYIISRTGLPATDISWFSGEPDNAVNDEDCSVVTLEVGPGIHDINCNLNFQYICKVPPQFTWLF